MSPSKKILMAAALGVALTNGAFAADAVTYPAATPAESMAVYDSGQFDWNRFYAGISGNIQDYDAAGFDWEYGVGLQAGINTQIDFYLLGGEVAISGIGNDVNSRTYGQVLARGGLVVTDDAVIYAAGGYGMDFSAGTEEHWLLGGGLEYAVAENISLRAQYLHGFGSTDATPDMNQFSIGLNYHF